MARSLPDFRGVALQQTVLMDIGTKNARFLQEHRSHLNLASPAAVEERVFFSQVANIIGEYEMVMQYTPLPGDSQFFPKVRGAGVQDSGPSYYCTPGTEVFANFEKVSLAVDRYTRQPLQSVKAYKIPGVLRWTYDRNSLSSLPTERIW